GDKAVFPEPQPLLSNAPSILGLDGSEKMGKSRNNAVMLSSSEDETAAYIKTAKTDVDRLITYDPVGRPEVSNLLLLLSLCTKKDPETLASEIGNAGASRLKSLLTEALNEYLRPLRQQRRELEQDPQLIRDVLKKGTARARDVARQTLAEVMQAMGMTYGIQNHEG
ncbi:MAG: tryptophan--tRNA ligase, partial [Dehalococcoidia bacterium]